MDDFSRLPDDLVTHILSFLPTEEAASTSLLSRRWRNLWKRTGVLRISSFKRRRQWLGPPESSCSDRSFDMTHLNLSSRRFKEFWNLKSIHLSKIFLIRGDALESINHNCPLLEQLTLIDVYGLKNLKVSSSLSRLKDIYISSCHGLESVVIESPNLVSFEYSGRFPTHVYHLTAPRLKKFVVLDHGGTLSSALAWMDRDNSVAGGELVSVDLNVKMGLENDFDHSRLSLLNHAKEMRLRTVDRDLSGLDGVLRASSSLETLRLSVVYSFREKHKLPFGDSRPDGKWKHQFLRKIRIEGCCCSCYELILLNYLFKVAVGSVEIEMVMASGSSDDDLSKLVECIDTYIGKRIPRGVKFIVHPYS